MPPRYNENIQTLSWRSSTVMPTTITTAGTSTAIPTLDTHNNTTVPTNNFTFEIPYTYGNFFTKYDNNYIIDVSASNISNMDVSLYDDRVCLIIKFSDIFYAVEKEIGITIKRDDPMFNYFMMLYSGWNEIQKSKSELKERKNKINSFKAEDLNEDLSEFLKE